MIVHKNFMAPRRDANPYRGFVRREQSLSGKLLIKSREDQVDISEQAHQVFQRNRIIELERARAKKIAEEYLPIVKELFGRDGDLRTIVRLEKIIETRQRINSGEQAWNNGEALAESTERLIALMEPASVERLQSAER
jgi:hypothetical protein